MQEEDRDLGLKHHVPELAQVAALDSLANVSLMPVSMYGAKRSYDNKAMPATPACDCVLVRVRVRAHA